MMSLELEPFPFRQIHATSHIMCNTYFMSRRHISSLPFAVGRVQVAQSQELRADLVEPLSNRRGVVVERADSSHVRHGVLQLEEAPPLGHGLGRGGEVEPGGHGLASLQARVGRRPPLLFLCGACPRSRLLRNGRKRISIKHLMAFSWVLGNTTQRLLFPKVPHIPDISRASWSCSPRSSCFSPPYSRLAALPVPRTPPIHLAWRLGRRRP